MQNIITINGAETISEQCTEGRVIQEKLMLHT